MKVHESKLRVRYGETDQMGYMYYGNYPEFLEVARTELLREAGMTYRSLEEEGIVMPVTELWIKYIRPAKYDEEITIRTHVRKLEGVRIIIASELVNEKKEVITIADVSLTFINSETGRPCSPPDLFAELLQPYLQKEENIKS